MKHKTLFRLMLKAVGAMVFAQSTITVVAQIFGFVAAASLPTGQSGLVTHQVSWLAGGLAGMSLGLYFFFEGVRGSGLLLARSREGILAPATFLHQTQDEAAGRRVARSGSKRIEYWPFPDFFHATGEREAGDGLNRRQRRKQRVFH